MKVALVHDYFTQLGGAERVAEALYQMLPNPTVFATVSNPKQLPEGLRNADVRTSWMQSLPAMQSLYRHYFPLYPLGVSSLNLKGYDLVVSSSSGYAKGVRVDANAVHICYCHTPMRWVWRYSDYASREGFGLARRLLMPLLVKNLKRWDLNAARQPDQFVVNSTVVAERVWAAYKRQAIVIPPPINVDRFRISPHQEDYYLVLSRLVAYKRIDLAVEACTRLHRPLIIIGEGPDRTRLQALAGPTVKFLGRVSDSVVESYAGRCRALLFPGEEDFGMVPLEINAAGRPVIAYKAGGALDTVIDGVSGLFFDASTVGSLMLAIEKFESILWDAKAIRKHAERFDVTAFHQQFSSVVEHFLPNLLANTASNQASAVASASRAGQSL